MRKYCYLLIFFFFDKEKARNGGEKNRKGKKDYFFRAFAERTWSLISFSFSSSFISVLFINATFPKYEFSDFACRSRSEAMAFPSAALKQLQSCLVFSSVVRWRFFGRRMSSRSEPGRFVAFCGRSGWSWLSPRSEQDICKHQIIFILLLSLSLSLFFFFFFFF